MKVSVLLRTSEYRGDHSADVFRAYEVKPDETVTALLERLIPIEKLTNMTNYNVSWSDCVELRWINDGEDE